MKTMNVENLKKLPDDEKAQIAQILLKSERKNSQSKEPLQFPMLKLLKHSTASNLTVKFLRVSSEGQEDGFSLPAQKEKADEYITQNGLNCVKSWSVTESASKEFDRKEFFDMLRFVSENGIKNIIFDKIDRACRGLRAAVLIEDLVEAGVRFHFTRDGFVVDKNSPPGDKLRFYLGVVLAKYYIDNLKTEIRKGLDERWERGYWNGPAPVGYRNLRDDSGRAWIELDKKVAPYIQEVFELYATGNYSHKALEKHLAGKVSVEKEIRSEKNGELVCEVESYPITDKCLEHVVCNPFYYGARRRKGKVVFTGKEKHVPLISKTLFDACQKIKAIRAQRSHISLANEIQKPFMNLMKCGVCGHFVTGEVHKKSSGKVYIYYHCANQDCHQRRINVRQETIVQQLMSAFAPFSRLTPKATAAFIEGIKEQIGNLHIYSSEELVRLEEKKKSIEERSQDLQKMVGRKELTESECEEILGRSRKLLRGIEVEMEAHAKVSQQTFLSALGIIELMGKANTIMGLDGFELKKARFAKMVLSNPALKDGKLEYHYIKPFDDLVVLTGSRNWWRRRESNPRP
jgi:site-specific DNA recombinase